MDPASLTTEFHDKSIAFVNDTFSAVQRAFLPFYEVGSLLSGESADW